MKTMDMLHKIGVKKSSEGTEVQYIFLLPKEDENIVKFLISKPLEIFYHYDYHPYSSVRKLDNGFDEYYRRSGKDVDVNNCTVIKVDINNIYPVIGEYVSFALDFIDEFYEIINTYRDLINSFISYSEGLIKCKNILESELEIKL